MKLLLAALLLTFSTNVHAAGLGDTYGDFEKQWNRGYRQEFSLGSMTDVHVGIDKKRSLIYTKGWNDFAGRIGKIQGETGLPFNSPPTVKQFMSWIRAMMPADAKLIGKYTGKYGFQKDIYIYKSASLAKMTGINKSSAYLQDAKSIGKFFLVVNHNIDDSRYVVNFLLCLGSGVDDIAGMKKVSL